MQWFIYTVVGVTDAFIGLFTGRVSTHRVLLGPGVEPQRWWLGRWRALRTLRMTMRRVPAYREYLRSVGGPDRIRLRRRDGMGGLEAFWATLPETDKDSYIKRFPILDRCVDARLPRHGVVVDESSGSSGTPTSWVRGSREREAVREILQVGYSQTASTMTKQPFVLNCFSLGAWATGMNVTSSLTDVTMIKSIGPNPGKVIATMREFGPHFTYVIMSYPPFLKALFDDDRLDWSQYDIVCAFGGEGISENMRAHLTRYAYNAYGSYGASDLEINLAIETDYTIELRKAIAGSPKLSAALTKQAEYGVLPMIFQFNPFNYLIETNERGELVVTITRKQNINPRIRYNIHDRGHVMRVRDLEPILERHGLHRIVQQRFLDLPLLFHYGRSDLSVDFNGAVVAPDSLRDAVFGRADLASRIENHRLISFEDAAGDRQLHIALQLTSAASEQRDPARDAADADALVAALRTANGDFHNAILTSGERSLPTIAFYGYREGPFREEGRKLKNEYVWHLAADEVDEWNLDRSKVVAR